MKSYPYWTALYLNCNGLNNTKQDMTEQEFAAFVAAHEWRFAKSLPKMPHYYVVRQQCRADDEFVQAVSFIRKYGFPKAFYKKTYIYYDFDGNSYWTMGNSLDITKIINRVVI